MTFLTVACKTEKKSTSTGASTKGNTIVQFFGIRKDQVVAAAEIHPDKIGRFLVGSGIPIIHEDEARKGCRLFSRDAFRIQGRFRQEGKNRGYGILHSEIRNREGRKMKIHFSDGQTVRIELLKNEFVDHWLSVIKPLEKSGCRIKTWNEQFFPKDRIPPEESLAIQEPGNRQVQCLRRSLEIRIRHSISRKNA